MIPAPELHSIAQVQAATGLGRSTLMRTIARGELLAVKVGRRTMIRATALRDWLDSRPPAVIRPAPVRPTALLGATAPARSTATA